MHLKSIIALGLVPYAAVLGDYVANRHLWYKQPAESSIQALAIGNGRLGGMVLGSATERIILNEHSVWSGNFQDRINSGSLTGFPEARELLKDGEISAAGALVLRNMSAIPNVSRAYGVTNDLYLEFGHTEDNWENYERWLDTLQGHTGLTYEYDGIKYSREVVASHSYGVIALRLKANKAKSLNVTAGLYRDRGILDQKADLDSRTITVDVGGSDATSIAFSSGLRIVVSDAKLKSNGTAFDVVGATTVDLFYDTETEFRWDSKDKYKAEVARKLDAAEKAGFETIKSKAVKDHEKLIGRVTLELGDGGDSSIPTDKRLEAYRSSPSSDHSLIALMFQFGRHLLVSSSRETDNEGFGLPANLQGIWNENYSPPWGGKYTANINLEMNYWLAETTNLAEALSPLWDLLNRGSKRGKEVAKRMYGCDGSVSHHNFDLWGDSAPHDNGTKWTMWPMSQLWLSTHMMEHYHFTGDKDFLANKAWDLFHNAATFLDCYLFEFEGYTSTGPSSSPENAFRVPKNYTNYNAEEGIDISPTMDMSLIRQFYKNLLEIASTIGVATDGDEVLSNVKKWRDNLRPHQIGSYGQIQEWRNDYVESEVAHRHISHLFDLFPGSQMSPLINKTLADAARVSLKRRLDSGGAGTGWSRTWTAACFSRLLDGDQALNHTQMLIQEHTMLNLFNNIDSSNIFQIDSNFGMVAVVAEMLLQSHTEKVHLLPALPGDLKVGSVSGLVARGGFEVSISWDKGNLVKASILSRLGGKLSLRVGDGLSFKIDGKNVESIDTVAGKSYSITLA